MTEKRPSLSYAQLAALAINASPEGKCTVGEIYAYVQRTFPFYQGQGAPYWKVGGIYRCLYRNRWPQPHSAVVVQNSIRHNLSTGKGFFVLHKVPGGNIWSLHDAYRQDMILGKTKRPGRRAKSRTQTTKSRRIVEQAVTSSRPFAAGSGAAPLPDGVASHTWSLPHEAPWMPRQTALTTCSPPHMSSWMPRQTVLTNRSLSPLPWTMPGQTPHEAPMSPQSWMPKQTALPHESPNLSPLSGQTAPPHEASSVQALPVLDLDLNAVLLALPVLDLDAKLLAYTIGHQADAVANNAWLEYAMQKLSCTIPA